MNDGLFITGLALGVGGLAVGVWMLAGPGFLHRRAARLRKHADRGYIQW